MLKRFTFFCLMSWMILVNAAQDSYQFAQPEQQQRFTQLTLTLRCLVCQNQTLADSNSPLAQDLRQEVGTMIKANMADEKIISYLTQRYGDFILYKPQVNRVTWLLWFGPFLLLVMAFLIIGWIVKKRHSR